MAWGPPAAGRGCHGCLGVVTLQGSCTWGRGCLHPGQEVGGCCRAFWAADASCGSARTDPWTLLSPLGGNQRWGGGIGEVSELGGFTALCPLCSRRCPGVALGVRGAEVGTRSPRVPPGTRGVPLGVRVPPAPGWGVLRRVRGQKSRASVRLCCVCVRSASAELCGRAEPRGPPGVCDLVALLYIYKYIKHHMVEKIIERCNFSM